MSLNWAALVHEKLAVIATFAYSQKPLTKVKHRFRGEWKFLDKIIYDIPRQTATQALIDFALYFRTLDEEQRLTDYWRQSETPPTCGMLFIKDGNNERLTPREMGNKIIHAERIEWDLSGDPKIICIGRDKVAWLRAEIDVDSILFLGAQLGS